MKSSVGMKLDPVITNFSGLSKKRWSLSKEGERLGGEEIVPVGIKDTLSILANAFPASLPMILISFPGEKGTEGKVKMTGERNEGPKG